MMERGGYFIDNIDLIKATPASYTKYIQKISTFSPLSPLNLSLSLPQFANFRTISSARKQLYLAY